MLNIGLLEENLIFKNQLASLLPNLIINKSFRYFKIKIDTNENIIQYFS